MTKTKLALVVIALAAIASITVLGLRVHELKTELATVRHAAELYELFHSMGIDKYCEWMYENEKLPVDKEASE